MTGWRGRGRLISGVGGGLGSVAEKGVYIRGLRVVGG